MLPGFTVFRNDPVKEFRSNFPGIQALQGSFCVLSTESFVHLMLTTGLTQTGRPGELLNGVNSNLQDGGKSISDTA